VLDRRATRQAMRASRRIALLVSRLALSWRRRSRGCLPAVATVLLVCGSGASVALDKQELAVIYNTGEAGSLQLATHYARQRAISSDHIFGVTLGNSSKSLPAATFTAVHADLLARLPDEIQAYALVWNKPYRVGCMSVTSAFAFGYDEKYCAVGCKPTAANPYYGSASGHPYRDHGVRPAMLVGAGSATATKALIARSLRANLQTSKAGAAYLVSSGDVARDTRVPRYALAARAFADRLPVHVLRSTGIAGYDDVMFYFIGAKHVANLDRISFAPGAIADHLTSHGGELEGGTQMSAVQWLVAGATGSFGAVVEPCNFPQKFPDPPTLMRQYLNGDTLIEAYWKSVLWPGQGLFIGAPLARPYAAEVNIP
jgi:uncharacterized protein (TIGR03790 family)